MDRLHCWWSRDLELPQYWKHECKYVQQIDINGYKHEMCDCIEVVVDSESIYIGEVSWLKAMLFEDEKYVPDPIRAISELIGLELVELTPNLRDDLVAAIDIENRTNYSVATTKQELTDFLDRNIGGQIFT